MARTRRSAFSKKVYSFKKTLRKLLEDFVIYGLPQIVNFLLTQNPDVANMSVAAFASLCLKGLKDYYKHKK